MMDTISNVYILWYADGGAVARMEDTSDWSSFLALDPPFFGFTYFYFYFLDGDLDGDFDAYFSLLFDLPDFTDLSSLAPSAFFLLFESPAIQIVIV